MFIHLNVHSNYSLLSGTSSITSLLVRAKDLGYSSIAQTDTNNLYGSVKFYKSAKEFGIKPIIGVKLTEKKNRNAYVIMLIKNKDGYIDVSKLITARYLDDNFELVKYIKQVAENVFIFTSVENILLDLWKWNKSIVFGEFIPYYLSDIQQNRLVNLSHVYGIPLVITNNVHMVSAEEYTLHKVLRAIDNNTTLSHLKQTDLDCSSENYLKSPEEMQIFCHDKSWIENIDRIVNEIDFDFNLDKLILPKYTANNSKNIHNLLYKEVWNGFYKLYGHLERSKIAEAVKRLRYELSIIKDMDMEDYFMIVYEIVNFARRENIPFIGRGSGASSIVSYCLGLTPVDPIRYNLYFERFLNKERQSPPDIDIDFSWRRRNDVLRYVYERFGSERVAMICETITFRFRSAIREVAKVYGLGDKELDILSRRRKYAIEKDDSELERDVLTIASKIDGFPQHLSVHAGGIVITEEPIVNYVPLEKSANGLVVTQFDMYTAEDIGLVKIDLLAQRALGVVFDTLRQIKENGKPVPNLDDFETITNDPETLELIKNGTTMGCFYIESPAMRTLLKKLVCDSFEMVVVTSSIIRPGVAESGMMKAYVDRHLMEDKTQIKYLHPKLKEILGETYGIMIYQEDVLRISHEFIGLTLTQADTLRRAMSGKSRGSRNMKQLHNTFIELAKERNIDETVAEELWRQVESFSSYSFCKAHSAAYSVLSFQVAYLKAHYPAELMSSVLSNQGGFYSTSAYISESKRIGLKIIPPDINSSNYDYKGYDNKIRIGLMQIKDLSYKAIKSTLEQRRNGEFTSLRNFINRTNVTFSDAEIMIRTGLFDSIYPNRSRLLCQLYRYYNNMKTADQMSVFLVPYDDELHIPNTKDYSIEEKQLLAVQYLSFPLDVHWEELFPKDKITNNHVSSKKLKDHINQFVKVIGIPITVKNIITKQNRQMRFITLEDKEGLIECVIFPNTFEKLKEKSTYQTLYSATGRVQNDHGVLTLVVSQIEQLYQPIKFDES